MMAMSSLKTPHHYPTPWGRAHTRPHFFCLLPGEVRAKVSCCACGLETCHPPRRRRAQKSVADSEEKDGSPGRDRTSDQPVNSRTLSHFKALHSLAKSSA